VARALIEAVKAQESPQAIRLKGLIGKLGGLPSDADDEFVLLGRQR
jgi:hypothetical protein